MYQNEQVKSIKAVIATHLERRDVVEKLRRKIQENNINVDTLDDNGLVDLLKDLNLLDNIMTDIKTEDIKAKSMFEPALQPSTLDNRFSSTRKALMLTIGQGKAFLDYMEAKAEGLTLQFCISFLRHKHYSARVSAQVEPAFKETMIFEITPDDNMTVIDYNILSKLNSPIELALFSVDKIGQKKLLAVKSIEWRFILSHPKVEVSLELEGLEAKSKMSIGLIQIGMELLPAIDKNNLMPERMLLEQFSQEKKILNSDVMRFYDYTTEWWNDYRQLKPGFDKRPVKIYGEDESGVFRPLIAFVRPLLNLKGIDSPYHAARFVGLIPYKRNESPGGERKETWHSFNTFIGIGYGDSEDHASLLCSMLLGFGLDAYVIIGYSSDGPHAWVLTRTIQRAPTGAELRRYTFWESLTGQRYEQKDPRVNNLYRKVGCVFNHKNYYANMQDIETAFHLDFEFENDLKWKALHTEYLKTIKSSQPIVALHPCSLDVFSEEEKLEKALKNSLAEYRQSIGLNTKFDDKLSYLLTPAVSNYEMERTLSVTYGQEDFQYAIKSYIPENHTFKAFPIQFNHRRSTDIFNILKNAPVSEDILATRGDSVLFGIKTKLFVYPENYHSLWVVIAVRYLELD